MNVKPEEFNYIAEAPDPFDNMHYISFVCKFCGDHWSSNIYAPGLSDDVKPIGTAYCSDECRQKHIFEELSK